MYGCFTGGLAAGTMDGRHGTSGLTARSGLDDVLADLSEAAPRRRFSTPDVLWTVVGIMAVAAAAITVIFVLTHTATWGSALGDLLGPTRAFSQGRPPGAHDFVNYGATTFVLYLPLVMLPHWLAVPLTQAVSLILVAFILAWWGGVDGQRPSPWLAALLVSPPALQLLFI